jgi:hypothetical protein
MPVISMFFGLIIRMYYKDHNPPHIHVEYGEWNASVDFNGKIIVGELPEPQKKLVSAWCEIHKDELLANWSLCNSGEKPFAIKPLR